MLVNTKEMLLSAQKERRGMPAPDFFDLDSARCFVQVAEERGRPLILSYAQVFHDVLPLEEAALIGKFLAERASVPVALHLDHGMKFVLPAPRKPVIRSMRVMIYTGRMSWQCRSSAAPGQTKHRMDIRSR